MTAASLVSLRQNLRNKFKVTFFENKHSDNPLFKHSIKKQSNFVLQNALQVLFICIYTHYSQFCFCLCKNWVVDWNYKNINNKHWLLIRTQQFFGRAIKSLELLSKSKLCRPKPQQCPSPTYHAWFSCFFPTVYAGKAPEQIQELSLERKRRS